MIEWLALQLFKNNKGRAERGGMTDRELEASRQRLAKIELEEAEQRAAWIKANVKAKESPGNNG